MKSGNTGCIALYCIIWLYYPAKGGGGDLPSSRCSFVGAMSDNQALRQIQARPRPRLRGTLLARAAAPHAVPRADDLSASQVHQSELDESSQETVCHQTPQRLQVPPGWPSVGPHPPGGVQTLLGSFDPTIDGGVLLSNAVLDILANNSTISVHQNRCWTSSRTRSTRMAFIIL